MLFLNLLLIIFKEIDRCPTTVSLLQVFFSMDDDTSMVC